MDLRDAVNCIRTMKERGSYRSEKIGVVIADFFGMCDSYKKGTVIIYKDEGDGTITAEIPLSPKQISEEKKKGSLITTMATIINVPKGRVEEILLNHCST